MNTTVKSTYQSSIHVEYTDIYYRHRSVAKIFPYLGLECTDIYYRHWSVTKVFPYLGFGVHRYILQTYVSNQSFP